MGNSDVVSTPGVGDGNISAKCKLKFFLLDDNRFDAFSTEAFFRSQFEEFELEFIWSNCLPPHDKYDSWIEEISKSCVACAIIDYSLSQYKSGMQVAESIRIHNKRIPIILLSGTDRTNPAFANWKERGIDWLVDKNHLDRHFKDISELVAATLAYQSSLQLIP